jgi:ethanolamine kinase
MENHPSSMSMMIPTFDFVKKYLKENIPFFNDSIDTLDIENSVKSLVLKIFPDWSSDELIISYCEEGITNKLVKVSYASKTILIRCYGNGTSAFIDRESELISFVSLHLQGNAPPLYARFRNGICYGFLEGKVLTFKDLPLFSNLIAKRLAQWHKIHIPNECNYESNLLWKTLDKWMEQVNPSPLLVTIKEELKFLKSLISPHEDDIVFCHNDLLCANIIYRKEVGDVIFIDYEYASYSFRAFDIANHFNEFSGFDLHFDSCPNDEFKREWLTTYLTEYLNNCPPSDEEVDSLFLKVEKFILVSLIYWALWALIQSQVSDIDFDFWEYAIKRMDEFSKRKKNL